MKNRLVAFILSALVLGGCDGDALEIDLRNVETIRGSGNVISQDMAVSDFERVSLLNIGQVHVSQGQAESLRVTTDDNIMPYVQAEVRGGTLYLGFDDEGQNKDFCPSAGVQFHLGVKDLDELELLGAGDFEVASLDTERLDITLNGAGNVNVGSLVAQELIIQLNGAGNVSVSSLAAQEITTQLNGVGDVELAGQVVEQGVFLNGVGAYRAAKLASQTAIVEVNGPSTATLWASDFLDARVPGPGTVQYYGSPQVTQEVSLVGRVVGLGEP